MVKQNIAGGITLKEVELIAFQLAQRELSFDEPIPVFSTRFPYVLESCLAVPFQKFYGKSKYRTLAAKASILFYLMIKNHPFQNGNKRIAIATLLLFLQKHNKWLEIDIEGFYEFTLWVAQSKAAEKDFVVMAAENFVSRSLVNFDNSL